MKSFAAPLVGLLALAACASSVFAQEKAEPRIPAADATNHLGKAVVIKGTVAQVTKRDTIIYLNFEKKFPDVEKVQGKVVEVDGKVELFKGKPQILLAKKSQLRVVEK